MADNEILANSNVPHEIVLDIITRVPVKSLLRFICVSKSFCSIISQPSFAEAHQKKGSSSYFLANFPCYSHLCSHQTLITLDLQNNQLARFSPFDYLNDPCFDKLRFLDNVNGLVCLWNNQEDVVVCNPFTKQHTFLPKPMTQNGRPSVRCSLGFDPTTKKHKILKSQLTNETTHWNIFTLGVDESWREIQCCFRFFPMLNNCSVYSNGVIYSVNHHKYDDFHDNDIAAFSVGEEDFRTVSFPPGVTHSCSSFPSLIEMKGEVALVDHKDLDGDKIVIYVLINYRTSTWMKKQTIEAPLELKQNPKAFSHFRFTSTLEGEVVLVPSLQIYSSYVFMYSFMLYYDRRTKGWIKVELCGVGDRNYWEARDSTWCNIVETTWSLK